MSRFRSITLFVVALVIAACSAPTSPAPSAAPAAPAAQDASFNGETDSTSRSGYQNGQG